MSKINVENYIDMYPIGKSDTHLFGTQTGFNARKLRRMDVAGSFTQGVDAETDLYNDAGVTNFPNGSAFSGAFESSDGVLFLHVKDFGTNLSFLFKSVDDGLTCGDNAPNYNNGIAIRKLGELGGTHYAGINILGDRGMTEAIINGVSTIFYGEYNTAGVSGTSAGAHVRILKSIDGGDTWSIALTFNTTVRTFTHCHFVGYDATSGKVYLGMGDGTGSGIVEWDGIAEADNLTIAELNQVDGIAAVGGKPYQCTDLLFADDYIYFPTDIGNTDNTDVNRGIFRFKRGLTDFERVSGHVLQYDSHAMYWGLIDKNGRFICTEILENPATDYVLYLYTSDTGEVGSWIVSGQMIMKGNGGVGGRSPKGLVEFNSKIYMGNSNLMAGKDTHASTVMTISDKPFNNETPDTVHPVYWVDIGSGSDSNDGYSPDNAFASIDYAVSGNRMTFGGRLILSDGEHTLSAVASSWQNNAKPAQDLYETVIEGEPAGVTRLKASGSIALQAGDGNVTLRNLRVTSGDVFDETLHDATVTENVNTGTINWNNG